MSDELLFQVEGSVATRAAPISLADAGLREREHLQEWVLANPEIVGDDVLIVTLEFDRWLPASRSAGRVRDRLDILGIDTGGTLVVAELKRDKAPDTVEMQAIKYASMAAQFTPATLALAYQRHLASTGEPATVAEAAAKLAEHAGAALDLKILRRPRLVLIAGEYSDTTMTSAIWLTQMGVEFTLIRYQAYSTAAGVYITTSRLWPLEQAEDLVVRPEEREEVEAAQDRRRRSRSVVARIIDAGLLDEGQRLTVAPDTQVTADVRDAIRAWVAEDPRRGAARWVNSNPRCLRWEMDGSPWSASGLAEHIISEAGGPAASITGPMWWADETGLRLHEILEEHTGEAVYPGVSTERDWSPLHELLDQVPSGSWTSYKDLADAIGSSAIAVGQHVARCPDCTLAYRVLTSRGTVSPGFTWADDERSDDPRDVLEREGVRFDEGGRADPSLRVIFSSSADAIGRAQHG